MSRLALDPGLVIDRTLTPLLLFPAPAPRPRTREEEDAWLADWAEKHLPKIGGGAAGSWLFTDTARTKLLTGQLASGDSYKIALHLSTSNLGAGSTTFAGVTNEVAAAFGYTAGGIAITIALSGTTSVKWTTATAMVWTAAGGPITAKYATIYEVGGDVLCYCQLDSGGADVSATDGNTLTVTMNASGVFTLT